MADQLSELLKRLLENTDQKKLKQALPRLVQLLSDETGQELVQKIRQSDPKQLSELLNRIDKTAMEKKIDRADVILKQAEKNPDYIKHLTNLL